MPLRRWGESSRTLRCPVGSRTLPRPSADPRNAIPQPLDDVLTVHEGFSDKKYSCGLEHCEFQITTERQVLLFRAGSREERDAWIENLKPIMQGYLLHALITAQGVRLHPPTSPSCPHQIALALASLRSSRRS